MKIQGVGSTPVYTEYPVQKSEGAPVQEVQPVKQTQGTPTGTGELQTNPDEQNNPQAEQQMDEEILKKSVEQANQSLKAYNRYIQRAVHEKTHTVMYTVRDSKTNEIIAEFPPKKIQDMIAKMWEMAGLFVDEKA
ncbi:flagellar protein FlaG [Fusibacter sp. 3D3]|uniref:flagellar protein FlaG n=1 Tax=Fusibacter sp. 3D3 TaxID=1048380 RepID=UPI0008529C72|nr:flagellar protein FlaG [Fusibacter sp. 3D3]GAU75647.1 flagellin [Fusibacter sp. 3D3]